MIKVGIVGAGLIGTKRAKVIAEDSNSELVAVSDVNLQKAKALEKYSRNRLRLYHDWHDLVSDGCVEAVVVSTPNAFLAPVSIAAANEKKHVLSEKPPGRNPVEAAMMIKAAEENGVLFRVGFNHRYHPAYCKLVNLYNQGEIGDLYFIRARYGHGARPGFEQEWRADPELAGGGELMDQGIHLMDLARNIMGKFTEVFGYISTFDWNIALEDNGFALLKNSKGQILSLHASWTQWKNLFSFEVYGSKGYLKMDGLGGSYGTETLRIGWRRPESGPPEEDIFVYGGSDESFRLEWEDFSKAIIKGTPYKDGTGIDGLQAIRLVYAIYESSSTGKKITGEW